MRGPTAQRAGVRSLRAAALCAGVGVVAFQAGRRGLPPPGPTPARWEHWWVSSGPVVAVFALARLALIGAAGLLALAFLAVSIDLLGRRAVSRPTRRALRTSSLVRVAIGVTASGGVLAACGSGPASPNPVPPVPPTLTNLEPAPSAHPPVPSTSTAPPRPSPGPPAAVPPRPASPPPVPPGAGAPPVPAPPGPAPAARTWRVQPGDSLWSIAQATVGSPPGQVAQYWAQLVQLNRARLPDPSNPDLIFPGDVVQLPPRQAAGP